MGPAFYIIILLISAAFCLFL